MKKLIFVIVLNIIGLGLFAQPILEKTYGESASICQLESIGYVYYSMDVINRQCHIYRMDHSLYKSIPIPTPEGHYLSNVQFVSEKLFNDDDLIELVYSYTKYNETLYYYTYETKLVNENGTILLTIPGAGLTDVIEVPGQGKKFLVYEYDYSVIPYRTYTRVYNLPESATKSADYSISSFGLGNAFPNPADRQIQIPIQLPKEVHSGMLELYDMNGHRIMSYPVTGNTRNLILPTDQLIPGTYLYRVDSEQWQSDSKKIVIKE